MLLVSIGKSSEKHFTFTFDSVFFFKLLITKSFEILPKYSEISFVSESLPLN